MTFVLVKPYFLKPIQDKFNEAWSAMLVCLLYVFFLVSFIYIFFERGAKTSLEICLKCPTISKH